MSSDEFVSLFSNRGKTIIIAILVPIVLVLGNAAWNSVNPAVVLNPVTKQIQGLDSSVSSLETRVRRVENSSLILDYRFSNIERFLCYENRKNATLSGIRCGEIAPIVK